MLARAQTEQAVMAGWMYIPYWAIGEDLELEKKRLKFTPKFADPDDLPVQLYRDLKDRRMLAVPRAYGEVRFGHLPTRDNRSLGVPFQKPIPKLPSPNHPAVKDPEQQAKFMDDMLEAAREYGNFIAYADTGSGKTVVSLRTAAQLGAKTIIMVPLRRLAKQWKKEIMEKLGVPEERIGIVQGPKCQWKDRDFVIAIMKSLAMRRYEGDFYKAFGTCIIDECHRVGTALLSHCAPLFPARVRIGLSATPDRSDGGDRVFFWHIGPVKVRSQARSLPLDVYVRHFNNPDYDMSWAKNHGARVKALSQDPKRNALIIRDIKRLWNTNRQILVIGEHVAHLQNLMDQLALDGIPREAMGQYTGSTHIRRKVRHRDGRISTKKVGERPVTDAEYERITKHARIIFATYGVFKEGIDIPRLDAGIDVTPISKAKQVIGRVRRMAPNKPQPLWITYRDEHCWLSRNYFAKRMNDYEAIGARVFEL